MLVLSYLWLLALVPFLAEKDDAEVQWHAKNGLVWTGAEFVIWILFSILSVATGGLACFLGPVLMIFWLGVLVLHVVGMMKALKGERFLLPFLSDLVDKF